MDGKGCWRDNVFVGRLWRTIKDAEVYLKAYDSVSAAKASLGAYLGFYNTAGPNLRLTVKRPIRSTLPACHGRNPRHEHRVTQRVVSRRSRPTFGRRHRG
jgi:putative transposase